MQVQLVDVTSADVAVLRNLFQLYAYDLSDRIGLQTDEQGRFEERSFEAYFTDPRRHALTIRNGAHLAGFALVHQQSRLTDDPNVWDVAEFFVMRAHRRSAVGTRAATGLFDRFRGPWEVRQLTNNTEATLFWRRVIDQYTQSRFESLEWSDERWRGPVQRFDSRP